MEKDDNIVETNKVLSINTRVKIIRLLSEKAFCVGALSIRLGIILGAVFQYMRILKSARLVVPKKKDIMFIISWINKR